MPDASSNWLFSRRADLLLFGGSAALALALLAAGKATGLLDGDAPPWLFLLGIVGVDVAHVWSTGWRVLADGAEAHERLALYAGVPLVALDGGRRRVLGLRALLLASPRLRRGLPLRAAAVRLGRALPAEERRGRGGRALPAPRRRRDLRRDPHAAPLLARAPPAPVPVVPAGRLRVRPAGLGEPRRVRPLRGRLRRVGRQGSAAGRARGRRSRGGRSSSSSRRPRRGSSGSSPSTRTTPSRS